MDLFWVETGAPGRAAVATRPRGGAFLADDMRFARESGVDVLVSAISDHEVRELWLENARHEAEAAGLRFVRFPIPNLLTPPLHDALPLLTELADHIREGGTVAAHCFGGIGRSPLIVASLLTLLGLDPDQAWARIRAARGTHVPDTNIQQAWVSQLTAHRPLASEPRP